MPHELRGTGPLAALRVKAGLSQTRAATELGIPASHLSRLESGHHDPRTEIVMGMARAYGVTVDVIINAIQKAKSARARSKAAA